MSGQLLELIIFAVIAVFIINRLISMLGTTSKDDPSQKGKSFFGEPSSGELKDVTETTIFSKVIKPKIFNKKIDDNLKGLIVDENAEEIRKNILEISKRTKALNISHFLKCSKGAFKAIMQLITDTKSASSDALEELIDKRYIDTLCKMSDSYGEYNSKSTLNAKLSEIYMFGNNIFARVLFTGQNVTGKISQFNEEWTFNKSILSDSPRWYLTDIDRAN